MWHVSYGSEFNPVAVLDGGIIEPDQPLKKKPLMRLLQTADERSDISVLLLKKLKRRERITGYFL